MFSIEWIQNKILYSDYYFSKHGDQERQNDNLTISDVEEALLRGQILEYYPDTGRGESCLVVGFTDNNQPIHIVCGQQRDILVIITLYVPTPPKFKNPFERGQ